MLEDIRKAFDGESVPVKNVALRKAYDEIEKLRGVIRGRDVLAGALGLDMDQIAVEAYRKAAESFLKERDEARAEVTRLKAILEPV